MVDFLDQLLAEEGVIYGVTIAFAAFCLVEIPAHHQVHELPFTFITSHGCGLGQNLDDQCSGSGLVYVLCTCYSGVSLVSLERLV